MLRKLFVFILLSTFLCLVTFAQDAPKPDKKSDERVYTIAIGGSGSYMGVEIKEITKENFAEIGLSEVRGVGISRVLKDSPAEKAGLQSNDVIIRFNNEAVTSSRKLTRLIREVSPDHKAVLTIIRSGSEIEIPVTIGKRKSTAIFHDNFEFQKSVAIPMPDVQIVTPDRLGNDASVWNLTSRRTIGVGVSPLTKQLGEYFGVTEGKGMLINRVSKDSPAERAGLQAGDVIVEIDGKPIQRRYDLMRSLGRKKEGYVTLTIVRDRNRQTITVTPEKRKGGEMFFNGFEFGDMDNERLKVMRDKLNNLKIRVAPKVKGVSMPLEIESAPRVL